MSTSRTIAGRYVLADLLGSGAMGDVYRATDTRSGDTVAIKHLKPDLVQSDADLLTRFQREGETLRDLNHPNIVTLLDVISENDAQYLVMEYVAGGDLSNLLTDTPEGLPVEHVLNIALDLADALTRAHRLDIIHRDLKPANVLLAEDGTPRLSDFGIALHREGERLTDAHALIGTMDYIAPEAINGQPIDTRADVWSFGVMLFEMLAGHRPFRGNTLVALLSSILSGPVPDLEALRPDCPVALVDLVYRMLVKDPQGRIPGVRHLGAELEDILYGRAYHRDDSLFKTPIPRARTKSHLPKASTPFVGRKQELEAISAHMDKCRLLTLLGPGGMGKSRLSVEAAALLADHYERGAYFVGLAPIAAHDQIVPTIAEALGFQFYQGGEPQQQLLDFLREKEMLLLLDNFEHVVEGAAFVSAILDQAPQVKILTTSRERLKLSAECVFDVQGLKMPGTEQGTVFEDFEAVRMFVTYARRVQPDYELRDKDKSAIVRICQLVGGMPLGIELAAGWSRSLSPQEVAEELEADLDILSTELADVPERQRSMRAAFDYSWRRLTDGEKDAFMKFSLFRGGATHEAASAVTGASIRTLTSLVDKSMLRRSPSGRFQIHELIRQFAAEKLAEDPGDAADTHQRHAEYYMAYLARHEAGIKGPELYQALDMIETDSDNVLAGWRWALSHSRWDLIEQSMRSLHLFYLARIRIVEGVELFKQTAEALSLEDQSQDSPLYFKLMGTIADLTFNPRGAEPMPELLPLEMVRAAGPQAIGGHAYAILIFYALDIHQHAEAESLIEEIVAFAQQEADLWEKAQMLRYSALSYEILGKPDIAHHLYEESLALYQRVGDLFGQPLTLLALGNLARFGGEYQAALAYYEQARRLVPEHADWHVLYYWSEGRAYEGLGEYDLAMPLLELGLHRAYDLGDQGSIGVYYGLMGRIEMHRGDLATARRHLDESARVLRAAGNVRTLGTTLLVSGVLSHAEGRHEAAQIEFEEALKLIPSGPTLAWLDYEFGRFLLDRGDLEYARTQFAAALSLSDEAGQLANTLNALVGVAGLLYAWDRVTEAAEIAALTIDHHATSHHERKRAQALLDEIASGLPSDEFEAAIQRGRTLTVQATVKQLLTRELAP